jgi:hypothetical protein
LAIASTPVSAEQPEAKARSRSSRPMLAEVVGHRHGRVRPEQAAEDDGVDGDDEDDGRRDQQPGRVGRAHQVGPGDQGQDDQADDDPLGVQRRVRGDQGLDPGGHADGRVQHVVDDQGPGRHQAGRGAEVGLGHRVGAAAAREGLDDLPVGDDQHGQQEDDRAGDRQGVVQPRRAGRHQDDDDGLGTVGDGGERVERESREALEGGQPMAFLGRVVALAGGRLMARLCGSAHEA